MTGLVLASGSTIRASLLRQAGVEFVNDPADIDEDAWKDSGSAEVVAARLALEKALAVSRRHPGLVVLGADSVLAFEDALISKSPDLDAAKAVLLRLAGRTHRIVSAVALVRDGKAVWQGLGEGRLTMRPLTAAAVDDYLAACGPAILSSVGCYHLEGLGARLFETIEGDYFSILGLPLLPVLEALREQGLLASWA